MVACYTQKWTTGSYVPKEFCAQIWIASSDYWNKIVNNIKMIETCTHMNTNINTIE